MGKFTLHAPNTISAPREIEVQEKVVYVDRPVEVQVEKIIYVDKVVEVPVVKEVETIKEIQVPVETIREVEKLVEIPVHIEKIITIKEEIPIVEYKTIEKFKTPNWCIILMICEALALGASLIIKLK